MPRTLLVAAVLTLAAGTPAHAQQPARSGIPPLPEMVSRPHVLVHYTTSGADAIDPAAAPVLADDAEHALEVFGKLGFPAPLDDGDGKVDIYAFQFTGPKSEYTGLAHADRTTAQSSGWIRINTIAVTNHVTIAHELFHVIQYAIYHYVPATWFVESTASWAGFTALGKASRLGLLRNPEVSLTCESADPAACASDPQGYQRWLFWQSLTDRFGAGVVLDTFRAAAAQAAAGQPHGLEALQAALTPRGTDVSAAYLEYANTAASGAFNNPGAKGFTPTAGGTVTTSTIGAPVAPQTLVVDHLAGRYLEFAGSGSTCQSARAQIKVTAPPGVPFEPTFDLYGDGRAVFRVPVKGNTAAIAVPWATCANARGKLGVSNASLTADGQSFAVETAVISSTTPPVRPAVKPEQAEASGAPEVRGFTFPKTLKFRKGKSAKAKVVLDTSLAGKVTFIFGSPLVGDLVCKDEVIESGDYYKTVKVRAGRNRFTLTLPKRITRGRHSLVAIPYTANRTEFGECVRRFTKVTKTKS